MAKFLIFLFLFVSSFLQAQIYLPIPKDKTKVYTSVDQMPCFRSCTDRQSCCEDAVKQFMLHHLRYPSNAKRHHLEGKVVLQFIVDVDGSVIEAQIITDIGMGCGEEAMRVLNLMPKWEEPGMQNNTYVPVQFSLPVVFNIDEIENNHTDYESASPEEAAKIIGAFFYIAKKMMEQSDKK